MTTPQKRPGKTQRVALRLLRFLGFAAGVLGASYRRSALADSSGQTAQSVRLCGAGPRCAPVPSTTPCEPAPSAPAIPLFSQSWIDDSGYDYARTFAPPVNDPNSLTEMRSGLRSAFRAWVRRGGQAACRRRPGNRRGPGAGHRVRSPQGLAAHGKGGVRGGRPPVRRGPDRRFLGPPGPLAEHRRPPRGRGPEARGGRELRRLLQRGELHLPAGRRGQSTAGPPARARRSGTSPPTSRSGPRTWGSAGC